MTTDGPNFEKCFSWRPYNLEVLAAKFRSERIHTEFSQKPICANFEEELKIRGDIECLHGFLSSVEAERGFANRL